MAKHLWLSVKLHVFALSYVNVAPASADLETIGNGICSSSSIEEVRNLLATWKIESISPRTNTHYTYSTITDFENTSSQ